MKRLSLVVAIVTVGWLAAFGPRALGAEKQETPPKPERLVVMALDYPGVVVPAGKEVSLDLNFINRGRTDETMEVRVAQQPPHWKARLKTYRYPVSGIFVPADDKKSLTFEAVPDKGVPPGNYVFVVDAQSRDGHLKQTARLQITVVSEQENKEQNQGAKITTSYPVLRGPSDASFEFSVEVDSHLDREAIFDLFAQGPKDWEVNFKPAYESKFISSLRLMANQNQNLAVEVKPAPASPAGEYPITIRVSSGDAKAEAKLTVVLTGTYGLEAGTPSGLLSLEARPGVPSNVSFYVKNTGTAVNHDIKFMTFKPENWKVQFKPERIEDLAPNDVKQVEMTITPYDEALVGDYSVGVKIDGERASKSLEFRTSVKASAAWGWIGIGIIVVVIAGLLVLFRTLGRR